jgi:hypothetical protein
MPVAARYAIADAYVLDPSPTASTTPRVAARHERQLGFIW